MVCDILVVGSGIAGLCLAWELAQFEQRVLIITDHRRNASEAAAGLLSLAGGRISRLHLELRRRCLAAYPDFLRRLAQDCPHRVEFCQFGHLRLSVDPERSSALESFARTLQGLGVPAQYLNQAQAQSRASSLPESVQAAVLLEDARVDPVVLLNSLEEALAVKGVGKIEATVAAVAGSGVMLGDGRELSAHAVVVAAGPETWTLLGEDPEKLWQTQPGWCHEVSLESELSHSLEDPHAPWTVVPRSESLARLATTVEPTERWPEGLPPGKFEAQPPIFGVRVSPPDGLPMAGLWSEGLAVLAGLGRNGFLTAPLLARTLARQLVLNETPAWLGHFSPHRPKLAHRRPHSRPLP